MRNRNMLVTKKFTGVPVLFSPMHGPLEVLASQGNFQKFIKNEIKIMICFGTKMF